MEKKTKLIFNRKIALKLSRMGFPIIDIVENYRKKHIEIYVFSNTTDFKNAFTNLVKQEKSNEKYNSNWRKTSNVSTNITITSKPATYIS